VDIVIVERRDAAADTQWDPSQPLLDDRLTD
jgi:hypothetical protein